MNAIRLKTEHLFDPMGLGIDHPRLFWNCAGGVTQAVAQSPAVRSIIFFGFVGLKTITGIILAVLRIFLNVEKAIGKEQAEIKARREKNA